MSTLTLLRSDRHPVSRDGGISPQVYLGALISRIGYSSQSLTIGSLHWAIIHFGEDRHLGGKLRIALEEAESVERNQCVIIHLAAAYGWVLQGRPRRPPEATRAQKAGLQIRQQEYQPALKCAHRLRNPSTQRDRELISARDVLSPPHDRGFGVIQLFPDLYLEQVV